MMSRNSADTSLRVFNAADHYGLDIVRGAFTNGEPVAPYLQPFAVDLFLSADKDDVQAASNEGVAAGLIYPGPPNFQAAADEIRIAFDGDGVLFSGEADAFWHEEGSEAFFERERAKADMSLPPGTFAKFLRTLTFLREQLPNGKTSIRTALVTARNHPAVERVIKTFRQWDVWVDEVFCMGGVQKEGVLSAFRPHIFFDDQTVNCRPAAIRVPTALVLQPSSAAIPLTPEPVFPGATQPGLFASGEREQPAEVLSPNSCCPPWDFIQWRDEVH